jgi:hypothetical protein
VSVAALVVADPQALVNTPRYWLPLCDTGGFVRLRVGLVAPGTLVKLEPPFVLTCHWAEGLVPLAAAVNDAFAPYVIETSSGFIVIAGAIQAGLIVKVPLPVEKSLGTAVFSALTTNVVEPGSAAAVVLTVNVDVFEVSPAAKTRVLGLKEALAPVGSEFAARATLNAVPVEPFRVTVTL